MNFVDIKKGPAAGAAGLEAELICSSLVEILVGVEDRVAGVADDILS